MTSDPILFSGVEISSGRKPFTLAGLDNELNVRTLAAWDASQVLSCFQDYPSIWLAVNAPASVRAQQVYADLKAQLVGAGFREYPQRSAAKQWIETDAQQCFHLLSGHKLWPRRSLEGRLQRGAILFEQGLQIPDPVDVFEEITRYKLIQGILPLEHLHSPREVDALVAAYLAWLSVNRPGQTLQQGQLILPAQG